MAAPMWRKVSPDAFKHGERRAPVLAGRAAYHLFCTPPRPRADDADAAKLAEKLGPIFADAETRRVATPDAEVAAYRWPAAQQPARGRVLLVHGWTACALVMALFVTPLRRAGFDVVTFDLPAHGASSGRMLNMPIGARALLAVADALGPFDGMITHSFGGPIAALALEGGSPIFRRTTAARIALIAAPHALVDMTRDFARHFELSPGLHRRLNDEISQAAGRPIESISTGGLLNVAGVPSLIIHDTDDDSVPFTDAVVLAAAIGAKATMMQTRGYGHRQIVVMPAIVRAAVRFISDGTGPTV